MSSAPFCVLSTVSLTKQVKHLLTDRLHLSWPALLPSLNSDLAFSYILASQTLCKPSLFAWRHAKTRSVRAGGGGDQSTTGTFANLSWHVRPLQALCGRQTLSCVFHTGALIHCTLFSCKHIMKEGKRSGFLCEPSCYQVFLISILLRYMPAD